MKHLLCRSDVYAQFQFCTVSDKWMPKWAILQMYHGENQLDLYLDEMMKMMSVLFYSASSLKQQSAGRYVAYADTLSWLRANQS